MTPTIAPDFQNLLPEHTPEELEQLEANCMLDRKHERMPPVLLWKNHHFTIIDGHHQYAIRKKLGLELRYAYMNFATRDEAMKYALDSQFGRRNLNASQRAMAYAKLPRQSAGGDRKTDRSANLHFDPIAKLAENAGVSERTMKSAAKVVDKGSEALIAAVNSGEVAVSTAAKIADLPKSDQQNALSCGITVQSESV
jgi:hypothetical protein